MTRSNGDGSPWRRWGRDSRARLPGEDVLGHDEELHELGVGRDQVRLAAEQVDARLELPPVKLVEEEREVEVGLRGDPGLESLVEGAGGLACRVPPPDEARARGGGLALDADPAGGVGELGDGGGVVAEAERGVGHLGAPVALVQGVDLDDEGADAEGGLRRRGWRGGWG